jgi:hypothetical protein
MLDFAREFIVYSDASDLAMRAILAQNDDEGHEHVVKYGSRAMQPHERNYSVTEKECLAIIYALDHFRYYVLGRKFTVVTDHEALSLLSKKELKNKRIQGWYQDLLEYNFDVVYKKGGEMTHVDPLSRIDWERCITPKEEGELIRRAHEKAGHHGIEPTKKKFLEMMNKAKGCGRQNSSWNSRLQQVPGVQRQEGQRILDGGCRETAGKGRDGHCRTNKRQVFHELYRLLLKIRTVLRAEIEEHQGGAHKTAGLRSHHRKA